MRERRDRKAQRADQVQHYDELESRPDPEALKRFREPAYHQVADVTKYLSKKYKIRGENNKNA